MLIFLIGFMGSGKSTLGRPLARRLGYEFVDLDNIIEEGEGESIGSIFAQQGEGEFRALESKYLNNIILRGGDMVISTGGGTPCFNSNMEQMNSCGVTVYLKLCPGMLADRLTSARISRPLLAEKSPEQLLQYIVEMLEIRGEHYDQANVVILNPSRDVTRLIDILNPYLLSEHKI